MQNFDDIQINIPEPTPVYDKYAMQKQRLLFNVSRSGRVCDAIGIWLQSFEGGLSKELFIKQVARLDFNDDIAIEQLERSKGRRAIVKSKKPPLPKVGNIVQMLSQGTLFIAVSGSEQNLHDYIRDSYQELKSLGRTYVLDLNDLRLEWAEKYQIGKSGKMLKDAKDAEFLFVVGFETPIDLPFHVGDSVNAIRRYRVEHSLPIISTFARFRDKDKFFQYFEKFSI